MGFEIITNLIDKIGLRATLITASEKVASLVDVVKITAFWKLKTSFCLTNHPLAAMKACF